MHLLIIPVFAILVATPALSDLLVNLPGGQVKGHELKTFTKRPYHAFQGIPFAKPPLGKLRFQAPDPDVHWTGVLDATKDSKRCYQITADSPLESEDCLYINVFTPVLSSRTNKTKLPVMFWFYGGGFRAGAATWRGFRMEYLMDEDVIFVTHNYRVGPFGFLSTGDMVLPGNAGLKDQNLALKWTKENIALFGGDPEKITIFGQSAGGASVGYQLLSPLSAGLFRGAIAESGSPMNTWTFLENPLEYTYQLAKVVANADVKNDSKSLLEYLQSVPAKSIDIASTKTRIKQPNIVVEPKHDGAFISQGMYETFDQGNFNKVPTIIGINSEERITLVDNMKSLKREAATHDAHAETLIPEIFHLKPNANRTEVGEAIRRIYLKDGEKFSDHLGRAVRYSSDNRFTRGVIKQGQLMSKHTDVYFYQFSYVGKMGGQFHGYIDDAEKVAHAEELRYIFASNPLDKYEPADVVIQQRMLKTWTTFAKTLNPTPAKSDLMQNLIWPKVTPDNYQYLDIDADLRIKVTPKGDYFLGWQRIFEQYGQRPFATF